MEAALAVSTIWGVAAVGLVWAALESAERRRMRTRMARVDLFVGSPRPRRRRVDVRDLADPLGQRIQQLFPHQQQRLSALLEAAGLGGQISAETLLGLKAWAGAAGGLAAVAAVATWGREATAGIVVVPLVAWFTADLWLLNLRARRRRAILRSLTTALDLLALSLEAGMGLDRSLRMISARMDSPLADELRRVLMDVDLGLARRQAFVRLGERVPLEDVRSLASAIVHAEDLGSSLVGVMKAQAQQLRQARRRQAEAEAMRAPVKMVVPMVLFTLPALFIVILAPVVLRTGLALGGMTR